jgi:hypothetical protein
VNVLGDSEVHKIDGAFKGCRWSLICVGFAAGWQRALFHLRKKMSVRETRQTAEAVLATLG